MSELQQIQEWYQSQCDGDWEHTYGVRIETLDNPGWSLTIDLEDTALQVKTFAPMSRGTVGDSGSWIHCKVEGQKFKGVASTMDLGEMLRVFLLWAGYP